MNRRFAHMFRDFTNSEKSGGIVLLFCTIISLFIANSVWGESYTHFWHQYLDASFSRVELKYSVEHWISDGLMAIFFLLVGLEIEREIYVGELSNLRNALLPIAAAIGGMVVPAGIHFLFNAGAPTQSGFGIPMATDIAFALGMLSLAGNRVPYSLKIFLTALAIIDDLGAILVIAIFYNSGIAWGYLGGAAGIFAMLLLFNRLKVHKLVFYLIPGVIMWYCMLKSGVHATITGVLLAFAIPFTKDDDSNPSYHLQHFLHKPVAFFILPLFALANTGIMLAEGWYRELTTRNSLGIILGLVLGKPVGILLFCWMLVKSKLVKLPNYVSWKHMAGAGALAGIGFTMSIFISNLAFTDFEVIQFAKVSVLIASSIAVVLGLLIFFSLKKPKAIKEGKVATVNEV
ncbi:MAG: Na+/H+ antiporter NhaA [Chitinophagaceae bacterium]